MERSRSRTSTIAGHARSLFASVAGDARGEEELLAYRLRTVRIGVQATAVAALALTLYLALPGRAPVLKGVYWGVLGITVMGALIVHFLPWRALFERGWGIAFMFGWSVLDVVLIGFAIWATGGAESPMFIVFGLTTLFYVASYPRRGQIVLTIFTLLTAIISVNASAEPIQLAELVMRLTVIGILAFMGSFLSSELMRQMRRHALTSTELERRSDLLATVGGAARTITDLSPDQVLANVVDAALALNFQASGIWVLEDDGSHYRAAHHRGLPESYVTARLQLDVGIVGEAFQTGHMVVENDYPTSRFVVSHTKGQGFRVVVATPIRTGGDLSAILTCGTTEHRSLTLQDLEAIDLLAALAGRAIENAERYQALEKAAEELRASTRRRDEAEAEKERLENQLRQAQKLEAVGMLAGGIAHDFNNLLSVIQNYTRFVYEDVADETQRSDLDEVLNASARGTELVRQLLRFSRREVVHPEVLNLNDSIADMQKMFETTLTEKIALQLELHEDLPAVQIDPGHVQQIIMNLLVNARDAMPSGGSVVMTTRVLVVDERSEVLDAEPSLSPGHFVTMSVADTGEGMSEEVRQRIFEPFYTTKSRESGTGLGLSTVYGIVRQAGGTVRVYSEEGHGSTFTVLLPVCSESAGERQERPRHSLTGRGERVLVVEDEESICRIVGRILASAGYNATIVSSPPDALELARKERFDLLLSDVVMPKMSGKDLARQVLELQEGIAVLFMSGYPEGMVSEQGLLEDNDTLLQKPFSADDLLEALDRSLGTVVGKR